MKTTLFRNGSHTPVGKSLERIIYLGLVPSDEITKQHIEALLSAQFIMQVHNGGKMLYVATEDGYTELEDQKENSKESENGN